MIAVKVTVRFHPPSEPFVNKYGERFDEWYGRGWIVWCPCCWMIVSAGWKASQWRNAYDTATTHVWLNHDVLRVEQRLNYKRSNTRSTGG